MFFCQMGIKLASVCVCVHIKAGASVSFVVGEYSGLAAQIVGLLG